MKRQSLFAAVLGVASLLAISANAGTVFWVYNATDFNTVTVTSPSTRAGTVKSNAVYEGKSDASSDGTTMNLLVAGNQFTVTDQNTQCANVSGTWEMTIDEGASGKNTRVGSQCVHIDTLGCGNLAIVIQTTDDSKTVTVGVKDRGSSACGGTFSEWVSWIKTGVSVVSSFSVDGSGLGDGDDPVAGN